MARTSAGADMTDESPRTRVGARQRAPRRPLRIAASLLVALLVLASVAGGVAWAALYQPDHDIEPGSAVEVVIPKGASTASIAEILSQAGVIPNALMFRLAARESSADGILKAGEYALTTGMGNEEVISVLAKGPEIVTYRVVIPEGFTARQIAARFADKTGVSKDELTELMTKGAPRFADEHPYVKGAYKDSLEGYLFPATYEIREGTSAEGIVNKMLNAFDANIEQVDMAYAESKNLTVADVVSIASIIEREASIAKERPLVASVIYNRLKQKMRLQLCATVLYELPGKKSLTYEDLKLDSPYNTYLCSGLPPGPIANPGLASLKAAAHPPKTQYLYYVLTGKDGSQTFTETYDEFLKAKRGAP
ncbi:MAG: endolytic transglycosylase MltG [Coriobacteriia bacterium]|nr:endolytic transglycosylase MltG [Coriobacteriia bacterium]